MHDRALCCWHCPFLALDDTAKPAGSMSALDELVVKQFLTEHLPHCVCIEPVARDFHDLRAALGHLLVVLREQGAIPLPPSLIGQEALHVVG